MNTRNSIAMMVAVAALIAFNAPTTAFAQMKAMATTEAHGSMMDQCHMDKMGSMMDMCVEHAEMLGLTDGQIAKLKPLHHEMQKKMVRGKAEIKVAELDLKEIMEVKDFDLEKANTSIKKISELLTAQHLEMAKTMKEVRGILTEDQFKKMEKMMPMEHADKKHPKKMMHK